MAGPIKTQFPGGCFLAFNWSIDRISASKLVEAVAGAHVEGYDTANIMLSSPGGLLVDAHYAVECLAALPIDLVMWNVSSVQSAANLVFSLGLERYAAPGTTFLFHQTGFEGVAGQRSSEKEVRDQLSLIETADKRSAEFIANELECDASTVMGWQKASKVMTEKEALEAGIIHAVKRPSVPKNAFMRQITLS